MRPIDDPSAGSRWLLAAFAVFFCATNAGAQNGSVAIVEEPADAITNVGGAAAFRVTATGAGPWEYQWTRDNQPLRGATTSILVLDHAAAAQAGAYRAVVTSPAMAGARLESRSATLTVNPAPAAPIVDPGFRADARLNTTPTAVLPLANGEVIIASALDRRLVRLREDGTLDPTFASGVFEPPFGRTDETDFRELVEQPDGRLLVVGTFDYHDGRPAAGFVRLNRDGTRDATFAPSADLVFRSADPRRIALQSDGKLLVLSSGGLVRLWADGRRDPTFAPAVGVNGNIATFAVLDDDRVFVALTREQVVARLLPDGNEDTSFARRALDVSMFTQLHALADRRLVVLGARIVTGRPADRVLRTLARWNEDGAPDPTFPVLDVLEPSAFSRNGSILLSDRTLLTPDGSRTLLAFGHSQFGSPVAENQPRAGFAPAGRIYLYGGFSFHHGVPSPRIVRINRVAAVAREVEQPPRILAAWAETSEVTLGETVTLRVAAVAPGPVTYEWRRLNSNGSHSTSRRTATPFFTFAPRYLSEGGNYSVRVLNGAGEAVSAPVAVSLRPAPLRFVAQPARVALTPGRSGRLHVIVDRTGEMGTITWSRDGAQVATNTSSFDLIPRVTSGETTASGDRVVGLELGPVNAAHAGTYTVEIRNGRGEVLRSQPIAVVVEDTPRFVNLSTRAFVGEGERATVLGFVIPPGGSRALMVRGVGPSLAQFGVAGVLADARLEMFDATGRRMNANDHWREYGSSANLAALGAFPFLSTDSADAMLVNSGLSAGAYTVRLSGPPGTTGTGLIELYEADDRSERFVNISTRAFLDGPQSPIIAGFAVRGAAPKRVLVRAAGPALGVFGVNSPLANPWLELRNARGELVATNDDWSQQAGSSEVAAAAAGAGAFPFPANSRDAALVVNVPAGNYTAVVTGTAASETGVTLVEIYEVP